MPSSTVHSWRGLPKEDIITIAHITDCPIVTVHACKCYQALIDSGAAISLIRHSTYKQIEDCYKTPIQPMAAKLNTADGSPMTTLGSTALHLQIAGFKFTHNFIICNQLPDMELIFSIDIQKKFSLSYIWDKDQQCYIQWNGRFLTFTLATTQKATIGTIESTLKIPPRHNGVVPIKISGPLITTHAAHFVTDDSTPKGRNPHINIINGIHKIKDRSVVNILISNYTNKHLTFHKGEYIGHLEQIVLDSTDQGETNQANSITLKKMMSKKMTGMIDPPLDVSHTRHSYHDYKDRSRLTPSSAELAAILTIPLIYPQYNLLTHLSNIAMHFHNSHPTVSSLNIIYIPAYYSHSPLPQTHLRWNLENW